MKGDNNTHYCLECKSDYSIGNVLNKYKNCYHKCKYYYFFDNNNNYFCTNYLSCPHEYPKLIEDKSECIKYNIKDELNNSLIYDKNGTEESKREQEIQYYNFLLKNIEKGFTSEFYDTSTLDNGKDEIIGTKEITITLTTIENQKKNESNYTTKIILGECETLLNKYYNISDNGTLYMKKIDAFQNGMKIPKVEYDIYSKLNGTNLIKLNLSVCEKTRISISVSVPINESIDLLNISSGYYNDKCYKSTSSSGTDISLNDRKKEFLEGNKTVCQEDCDFSDYNYDNQQAICSCKIKESSSTYSSLNINKTRLNENFADNNDKKRVSNLVITSCNVLSSKDNIISNTGFYLLLFILAFFIIIFIIFCSKGYNSLENKMDEMIHKKFKNSKKQDTNQIIYFLFLH